MENRENNRISPFTSLLILSILEMACCNQIVGVVALVYVMQAKVSFNNGNFMETDDKLRGAKVSLIVGVILGIILNIIWLALLFIKELI